MVRTARRPSSPAAADAADPPLHPAARNPIASLATSKRCAWRLFAAKALGSVFSDTRLG
jgi:hypothetical protein